MMLGQWDLNPSTIPVMNISSSIMNQISAQHEYKFFSENILSQQQHMYRIWKTEPFAPRTQLLLIHTGHSGQPAAF